LIIKYLGIIYKHFNVDYQHIKEAALLRQPLQYF
jgi:hypothetical protein